MENEICPVLIGFCKSNQTVTPNKAEVEAVQWVSWRTFFNACENPQNTAFEDFSPWSLMEGRLLKATPWITQLLKKTA
jgi:isopentenyldiphosphate isomerase